MIINKLDSLKQAKIIISENGDNFRVIPIPDSEIRVSYTDNRISSVTILYGDASYDIKSFETSSFSDSDTNGSADKIYINIKGNVDVAGDIIVTVESDFFDTVSVTVNLDQNELLPDIATKIKVALENTIVANHYVIGTRSADVSLTATNKIVADTSLNMTLSLDTVEGLTEVTEATVATTFALPELWELVGYCIAGGAKHNFKDVTITEDLESVTPSPFMFYYYEQGLYITDVGEVYPIYTPEENNSTPGLSEVLAVSNTASSVISGLKPPNAGGDAVNKTYADALLNSVPLMVGMRLSQTGTSDPTVNSFSSNNATSFTVIRDSVGTYTINFSMQSVESNYVLLSSLNKPISTLESIVVTFVNSTTVRIETYNAAGSLADDILLNSQILIVSKK